MTTKKSQLADLILSMTYSEVMELAREFDGMQKDAPANGFNWDSTIEAEGELGFAAMLVSWADGQD